ncbi:MAG TPA: trimeric intracellular cation channel family protein [Ottowia sp.]|uniref:trimeric intracellular cation channel family protein n=1 Tax=Ottowia sp. TaxID=1898956 RepID=UPI002B540FBA|nr:trimeric intracellular cation channel family protein [Ottowia sp.]HMN22436.1 trimeric intracellular cation channel family protein [Ottowia sp.]
MDLPAALPTLWDHRLRVVLEAAATLAFALSGVIEAARKRLDAVGVCVVAFAAAFGGGTLRDLLLDHRPFFWVQQVEYVWALLLLCVLAIAFLQQRHLAPTERAILWPDALGLGLFTTVGADLALTLQQPSLVAVLMGVITATFGGVIRDMLCNEIPRALADHRPYALWSFAGGWLFVGLEHLAWPHELVLASTVVVTAGARLLSVYRNWTVPGWRRG